MSSNMQPTCFGCYLNPNFITNDFDHIHTNVPSSNVPPNYFSQPTYLPDLQLMPVVSATLGLTDEEKEILRLFGLAWEKFSKLDAKHPHDNSEFLDAIHRGQQKVAVRVARRVNPEVWWQPEEPQTSVG